MEKTMMKKNALAVLLALLILLLTFIIGFVGVNVIMKKVTGHKNIISVPDLNNVHEDVARKRCVKIGLYTQVESREYNNDVKKGYVISQNLHYGMKVKKNRTINVVVSKGPKLVRVPFLETLSKRNATLRLKNVGLKLGKVNYRYSENVKKNFVIYSEPAAEEQIPLKSDVEIFVSLGKIPNNSSQTDVYKKMYNE